MANKLNRTIPHSFVQVMDTLAAHDLRIGQMYDNIFAQIRSDGKDPFYIENDELEKYFWDYLTKMGINPFEN
jgi:hypothetical protein